MKAIKCTLYINTRNGYEMKPIKCNSISEAVRIAHESWGFYYRVLVDEEVVRKGFCERL